MTRRGGANAAAILLSVVLVACQRKPEVAPTPVAPQRGLRITEREILLDGEKLVGLGTLAEQAKGVAERFKRRGPNDLEIVPVLAAIERRQMRIPDDHIRIELAESTPYRVVVEVMYSAGQGGVKAMQLFIPASSLHPAIDVDVELPTKAGTESSAAFHVLKEGIKMKFDGSNITPGCGSRGPGVAVPNRDGYDLQAFATCLKRLNSLDPELMVREGIVAADARVPALDVLRIANVARCGEPSCTGRRLGFPFVDHVLFGLPS